MEKNFGQRLRNARIDSDLTQKQASARLNIANNTLSDYERGVSTPNPKMLKAISELYRISTDYLLGLSDIPKPPPDPDKEAFFGWAKEELIRRGIFPADRDLTKEEIDSLKNKILEIAKLMNLK